MARSILQIFDMTPKGGEKIKKAIKVVLLSLALCSVVLFVVPIAQGSLQCSIYPRTCLGRCETQGTCGSGTYNGSQTGCKNGDSRLSTSTYYADARATITDLGYTKSWYGSGYSNNDYTLAHGNPRCRYQVIVSDDNHHLTLNQGPEPNCQPAYCANGNPDLILPFGCVYDTIRAWHNAC